MKRIFISFGVVMAANLLVASSAISPAVAAPRSDETTVTTLVFYAENRGVARIDNDADGTLEHGDILHRELALSRTRTGEIVGVSYTQSEIIAYKPEAGVDIRRVNSQKQLPGGDLIIIGLSSLPVGTVPQPGWQETYAIVGGTGKYEGARGSEKLTLLEDGKTFKLVLRIIK